MMNREDVVNKAKELVKPYGILVYLSKFGSKLYGTDTPESDEDYKGIYVPYQDMMILNTATHHVSYNTSDSNQKNTKDDIDIELKSVQTFLKELSRGDTGAFDLAFSYTNKDAVVYEDKLYMRYFHNNIHKFFHPQNINTFIILSNVSQPYPPETLEIAEEMSKVWPVTRTNCAIAPWFCRYVDVDVHTEKLHYLIYSRKRRLFWKYEESDESLQAVLEWAGRVNRGEVLPRGPGDGTFSSLVAAYYDQKAQGNPTFVFFIGPTIILIAIGFLVYDLCTSKDKKKAKRH